MKVENSKIIVDGHFHESIKEIMRDALGVRCPKFANDGNTYSQETPDKNFRKIKSIMPNLWKECERELDSLLDDENFHPGHNKSINFFNQSKTDYRKEETEDGKKAELKESLVAYAVGIKMQKYAAARNNYKENNGNLKGFKAPSNAISFAQIRKEYRKSLASRIVKSLGGIRKSLAGIRKERWLPRVRKSAKKNQGVIK